MRVTVTRGKWCPREGLPHEGEPSPPAIGWPWQRVRSARLRWARGEPRFAASDFYAGEIHKTPVVRVTVTRGKCSVSEKERAGKTLAGLSHHTHGRHSPQAGQGLPLSVRTSPRVRAQARLRLSSGENGAAGERGFTVSRRLVTPAAFPGFARAGSREDLSFHTRAAVRRSLRVPFQVKRAKWVRVTVTRGKPSRRF